MRRLGQYTYPKGWLPVFTTADLPDDMRFDPDNPQARAVRESGLTIECRHGDPHCLRCIREAARKVAATIER